MKESKEEYLMLREGILHLENIVNNTINFFYVFIASFLSFAITQKDTIILILSYIVIFPAYIIVLSKMEGMCRIGAYLQVYHEGKSFKWETRNLKLKSRRGRKTYTYLVSSNFPFVFVNIAVLLLYLYKSDLKDIIQGDLYETSKCIILILLFFCMLFTILKNGDISTSDYIPIWKKIK